MTNATLPRAIEIAAKGWVKAMNENPEIARGANVVRGELVRRAVAEHYQLDMENISGSQRCALAAYQGGYISIGKLAEEMGMHVVKMRRWLVDHDVAQSTAMGESDASNG